MWDIRKSLLTLSAAELVHIAKEVGSTSDWDLSELHEGDHDGCFDKISSFVYSKHLLESEDSGMSELLDLKDAIDDIVKTQNVLSLPELEIQPIAAHGDTTNQMFQVSSTLPNSDAFTTDPVLPTVVSDSTNAELQAMLTSDEELGKRLKQSIMVPTTQSPEDSPPLAAQANKSRSDSSYHNPTVVRPIRERMISIRDLSYLQRREFKVQGGPGW